MQQNPSYRRNRLSVCQASHASWQDLWALGRIDLELESVSPKIRFASVLSNADEEQPDEVLGAWG